MRRLFLTDCAAGDVIEDVYVVSNKQLAQAANGTHYIKAFVSDRTSQISARMWKATREIFNVLPDNGFARIRARVENYQSNLQCIIESVGIAAEGTFDIADLLPVTTKNVDEMFGTLSALMGSVRNKHVHALLQAYLKDERLMGLFKRSPAAQSFHHAWIGGLLEHTLNACEVANAVCKFYPTLNRDLVLAGVFLHDIAKTWELKYDAAFGYTDGGQLIGHIVKSAMWLEHKSAVAGQKLGEPIPRPLVDVLQHIILSHHGELEFGSPKTPATPEAFAVHMIENMDAKLTLMLGICRGEGAATDGNWTEYVKALNGRLYRPDVAPPSDINAGPETPEQLSAAPAASPTAGPSAVSAPAAPTSPAVDDAGEPPMKITNPLFESANRKR
ncbi:3'-5' exoribonuclease YhaM family protein [Humisphaera borealis]|uniref:HD domain-containing protein n=1 Tax=Humisphaera borealis TaxID=2807512 RepID=A0A7M2X558_9BACT|nr:HD domain-containing protein [Humisphaera borealis]QOV92181.1 HD domain-containing protein [Humisphaera borealis]